MPQPVPAVTDVKWVLMEKAILLAVAASLCTATASVCQRIGARSSETAGFDVWLVFRLARQPVWLLGVASAVRREGPRPLFLILVGLGVVNGAIALYRLIAAP